MKPLLFVIALLLSVSNIFESKREKVWILNRYRSSPLKYFCKIVIKNIKNLRYSSFYSVLFISEVSRRLCFRWVKVTERVGYITSLSMSNTFRSRGNFPYDVIKCLFLRDFVLIACWNCLKKKHGTRRSVICISTKCKYAAELEFLSFIGNSS